MPSHGSIVGVGATRRLSAVRWASPARVVWAWILTIPGAGAHRRQGRACCFAYSGIRRESGPGIRPLFDNGPSSPLRRSYRAGERVGHDADRPGPSVSFASMTAPVGEPSSMAGRPLKPVR